MESPKMSKGFKHFDLYEPLCSRDSVVVYLEDIIGNMESVYASPIVISKSPFYCFECPSFG